MRIEEVIGLQVRAQRTRLDMKQEQVGRALAEHLGKPWTRQSVYAAEQGSRAFTAAELVALAAVLGTSVLQLLTPPPGARRIETAGGFVAVGDVLGNALRPTEVLDLMDELDSAAVESRAAIDLMERVNQRVRDQAVPAARVLISEAARTQPAAPRAGRTEGGEAE